MRQCPVNGYGSDMPSITRKTRQRTIGIDDELWKKGQRIAAQRRETVSDVLRRALVEYTEKYGHLDPGEPDD